MIIYKLKVEIIFATYIILLIVITYKASGLKLYNISSAAIFLCLTWHPIQNL
jgi:hypothetical protein